MLGDDVSAAGRVINNYQIQVQNVVEFCQIVIPINYKSRVALADKN